MTARSAGTAFVDIQPKVSNTFQRQVGGRISGIMGTVGRAAGLALTAGAAAGAVGIGKSIADASGLQESRNAVSVVFGEAGAAAIGAFAEGAAEAVGLSERAVNELVTPIGAMFQNAGFGAEEAADASIDLTERAADMASVFNVDVADALGAIQAGLRGEADPLERFGVGLNAAAVEAYAMENGLVTAGEAMTDQVKAQARLGLIMEQTNKIQGDFANTSDSAANRQRILQARIEEFSAKIGTAFLPIWESVLAGFSRFVDWAAPRVESFINNQLIPAFEAIGAWWNENGPAIMSAVSTVFGAISDAIGVVVGVIQTVIGWFQNARTGSEESFGGIFAFAQEVWPKIQEVISGVMEVIRTVIETVSVIIEAVWKQHGERFLRIAKRVWTHIQTVIDSVMRIIRGIIDVVMGLLTGDWSRAWEGIKGIVGGVWDAIRSTISTVLEIIKDIIPIALDFVQEVWERAWDTVTGILGAAWDEIQEAISDGFDDVKEFFRNLPGDILAALGNVGNILFNVGKDIMSGLWDGLKDKWESVKGWFSGIGDAITNLKGPPAKDAKLLTENGRLIMQSLAAGLSEGWGNTVEPFLSSRNVAIPTSISAPFVPAAATTGLAGLGGNTYRFETPPDPNAYASMAMDRIEFFEAVRARAPG